MNRETFEELKDDMRIAGQSIFEERPDFCFGEWAGESAGEMVRSVTGYDENDFSDEEFEELIDAFFEG